MFSGVAATGIEFVTFDTRLGVAARHEGFRALGA
jgi:hypothetical protein